MLKIQDAEMIKSDGYGPRFVEIPCEKQKNGFDCGPFVMIFMDTLLENIEKGREVDDDKFVSLKVEEIRENLRNIINKEIAKQSEKNVRKHICQIPKLGSTKSIRVTKHTPRIVGMCTLQI